MSHARHRRPPLPRFVLLAIAIACLDLAACVQSDAAPAAPATDAPDPRAVHDAVLAFDGHADLLLPETPKRYYLPDGGKRTTLERLQRGGVDAIVFSIAVGPGDDTPDADAEARAIADAKLDAVQAWLVEAGDRAALATTPGDVERLHAAGKVAVVLGFQNARILGHDPAAFDRFHAAGVRVAGLAHAGHNAFADSSRPQAGQPVSLHGGLSDLGRQAVRRFNELGVLIDVSQLTPDGVLQTLALSRAPVIASHSNVRALIDHRRNLGDDELDAIKANGGVVLVTPFNGYLHAPTLQERVRIADVREAHGLPRDFDVHSSYAGVETLAESARGPAQDALKQAEARANVGELVDHIDFLVQRIGIAHVGIGSDFDHGAGIDGFDSPADAPNVTAELLRRGYTQAQIAAIWSGNLLRAWRAAQAAAG
ncbi:dipeptidase [Luteimonas sp. XNQY3]|nr:membrane dipeptidase [Luteimonas sp. XNQY3]MCD9004750.1 dipeptidase [Luteimonas sp. XNQY3]